MVKTSNESQQFIYVPSQVSDLVKLTRGVAEHYNFDKLSPQDAYRSIKDRIEGPKLKHPATTLARYFFPLIDLPEKDIILGELVRYSRNPHTTVLSSMHKELSSDLKRYVSPNARFSETIYDNYDTDKPSRTFVRTLQSFLDEDESSQKYTTFNIAITKGSLWNSLMDFVSKANRFEESLLPLELQESLIDRQVIYKDPLLNDREVGNKALFPSVMENGQVRYALHEAAFAVACQQKDPSIHSWFNSY